MKFLEKNLSKIIDFNFELLEIDIVLFFDPNKSKNYTVGDVIHTYDHQRRKEE
jgi:hypothetical protein